jgi:hypothetical protein
MFHYRLYHKTEVRKDRSETRKPVVICRLVVGLCVDFAMNPVVYCGVVALCTSVMEILVDSCGLGRKVLRMKEAWQAVVDGIEALRKGVPGTKTGFIRRALPRIDEALAEGYSLKEIWLRVREAGLDVKYKHFCTYVSRVRGPGVRTVRPKDKTDQYPVSAVVTEAQEPTELVKRDPFANLRRVEAERPVFNYRGTQDLEELVYGKRKLHKKG